MADGDPLLHHLHKLPVAEETLTQIFRTLWNSRNKGLDFNQKSYIQSLLGLPDIHGVDPVLACLRMIIRKCAHEDLTGDAIQKLFPVDLPRELQSILVMLLPKYKEKWKRGASRDQSSRQQVRMPSQVKVNAPPNLASLSVSELSSSLWPRQDDGNTYLERNIGSSLPGTGTTPAPCHKGDGSLENPIIFPRLKSLTWTLEKRSSTLGIRTAIITLKLQDYTQSPSGETEVRFQVSKDTLEAMLRSLTSISEQFST